MHRPIGLFDSGFGGLTVMTELAKLLPYENLIYLGDTAHVPYGNKSPATVLQYAIDNASFLMSKNIKLLIIPCHTACSHALKTLQELLSIPVIGVIQPGLALVQPKNRIAILATTSTIESGVYQSEILKHNPKAQIFPVSCPLFVPLIEEGFSNHPCAQLVANTYLQPLKNKVDAALLACTHYPLLRPVIQAALGAEVDLIEPAELCAQQAKELLAKSQLLNPQKNRPTYEFYASDDPEKFRQYGKLFFGLEIEKVEKNKNS
ncbi:MAG: glutamate racemase [Chlamydiae bacterium CG10_big_fil_rev_8_21_14_0_10_42_34]|nr:MAG: glutamate racemase [Chlamydiae bacterium CG10_big_fil_rev_8_21_14_0_10_42_34]